MRPQARRGRLLVRARRPADRQRPARLPALLRRLPRAARAPRQRAALVRVQERLRDPRAAARPRPTVLRRGRLPAPLHLAGALAALPPPARCANASARRARRSRWRALTRARRARSTLDVRRVAGRAAARARDAVSRAVGPDRAADAQPARPPRRRWRWRAFVFRTGLLTSADAGDIGFHERHAGRDDRRARRARARAAPACEVLLGWRARAAAATAGGFELHGAAAARARGGEEAQRRGRGGARCRTRAPPALLEPLLASARGRSARLGSSPIVNLHIVYDRPSATQPFAAGVGTPVQYLFDRTPPAGAPAGRQYLAVSLSGAEREMAMSVDELRERYLPALRELLPRARERARARASSSPASTPPRSAPTPGSRSAAAAGADARCPGWLLAGRVDRHRLAGDARGRRAQRPRRGAARCAALAVERRAARRHWRADERRRAAARGRSTAGARGPRPAA